MRRVVLTVVLLACSTGCDPWGPMAPLGPNAEDQRVLEALESDPAARLAPPDAAVHSETSGVESATLFDRTYCSPSPLRVVRQFYAEELPAHGWSATDRDGLFEKVIAGADATLTVGRTPPGRAECDGFTVYMETQGT